MASGSNIPSSTVLDNLFSGTSAQDTFRIVKGYGSSAVSSFTAGDGGDVLNLVDYGFRSFAGFTAAARAVGGDVVVALGNGETLTLKNVALSAFSASNVSFDTTGAAAAGDVAASLTAAKATESLATTGAAANWIVADKAGVTLNGTAKNDQIRGLGSSVLIGGAGDDTYIAHNQTDKIIEKAGEGTDTVLTWASSFALDNAQSIENLTLAGTGSANGTGNDLANIITGNSGANVLNGGRGNDLLVGGDGKDVFVMQKGGGVDTVADFAVAGAGADQLRLEGYRFTRFSDLAGRIVQQGADTLITLDAGDCVLLKNVKASDLNAANFQFVLMAASGGGVLEGTVSSDILTGGTGRDTFIVNRGGGSDTIVNFGGYVGGDTVKLVDTGLADFDALKAAATQVGADIVIALGNGETLTLTNIALKNLAAGNFAFDNASAATPTAGPGTAPPAGKPAAPTPDTGASTPAGGADAANPHPSTDVVVPAATIALPEAALPIVSAPLNTTIALNALTETVLGVAGATAKWLSASVAGAIVNGTSGNDQISAGALANVTMAGGAGDDIYIANQTSTVIEKTGEGIDTVQSWYSYKLAGNQSIENLMLMGTNAIDGTGNDLNNVITGNAANNVISAGKGNDIFIGKGGKDTFVIAKDAGTKTVADFAASGDGMDRLKIDGFSWNGFDALKGRMTQVGSDVHIALGGSDGIILKNVGLSSLSAANFVFLSTVDTLVGTNGVETLDGGDGNDILYGGAGRDAFVVSKGNGSDTILDFAGGKAGDVLDLKGYNFASFDALRSMATQVGADTVIDLGGGEKLTLNGLAVANLLAENVLFENVLPVSAGSNGSISTSTPGATITGTAVNNYMTAGAKDVTMAGGMGDDTYVVSNTNVKIVEKAGEGIDTVVTWGDIGFKLLNGQSVENVTLMGSANSSAFGNELSNIVTGNAGKNILNGGVGNDILIGKGGADIFVVAKGEGSDVIADFSSGEGDVISLDGSSFKNFAEIKSSIQQVGTNAFIALGNGQTLTLQNIDAASLTEKDFAFDLDKSAMRQTFRDDFSSFDRYTGTGGTWVTKFEWGGVNSYTLSHGSERQLYVDTDFRGLPGTLSANPLGLNPFSVQNGELVITAKPMDEAAQPYAGTYKYQSGMISSEATFAQTYGHFEMKATLPQGVMAWPAFWMIPVDNSWPPELDVVEVFGDQPNAVHFDAHSKTDGMNKGGYGMVGDLTGSHSFGVTWTPYTLTYYVDGREMLTIDTPNDMNKAMYMIVSMSVGGLAGTPPADLMAQLKIDSVTAYQLDEYTLEHFTLKTSATATASFYGTAGADDLYGGNGADLLDGKAGVDRLAGGAGDDTYIIRDAATTIVEKTGGGIDTARADVNYTLAANVENLTLTGTGNIAGTGNTLSNVIIGNAGDNVITGGGGNDILTGGAGKDVFVIDQNSGSDIITDFQAGKGIGDVVKLDGTAFTSFEEVRASMSQNGADVYLKLSPYETLVFRNHLIADFVADDFKLPDAPPTSGGYGPNVIGTAGNDRLVGSGSNNFMDGTGGSDILLGGRGDDTYRTYATGSVTIVEKAGEGVDTAEAYGSFTLPDNVENLKAMAWNVSLVGNGMANRITGHGGAEILNGKGGADWLFGGAGNDTFVYEKGSGYDTIADFHTNTGSSERDVIKFSGYGKDATLTHDGDVWTVHYAGGQDTLQIANVTQLGTGDYVFV